MTEAKPARMRRPPPPTGAAGGSRLFSAVRRAGAFTLIELLVVISIIVMLIALLLPALHNAREAGRLIRCMSTGRMVGLGVEVYTNDNKEFYPPHHLYYTNPNTGANEGFQAAMVDGDYVQTKCFTNQGCPYGPAAFSRGPGNPYYQTPADPQCGYGYNDNLGPAVGYLGAVGQVFGPMRRSWRRFVLKPHLVIIVGCNVTGAMTAESIERTKGVPTRNEDGTGSPYPGYVFLPNPRHPSRGLPMSFSDGHAREMSQEYIFNYLWAWGHGIVGDDPLDWSLAGNVWGGGF